MTARTCPESGKVRHPNPQAAHAAVAHIERRGGRRQRQTDSVYGCQTCNGYHVRSRGLRPAGARR